jgi:ribosomal protein S18 acetylase RimI-like enzyme
MSERMVKTGTASDEASMIAVVVLAFSSDPAARWTWPDPQQYLRHFPDFVKALGGKGFSHKSAYYVDGYDGAAMWLPPDVSPDENMLADLVQRTGHAPVLKDVFAVFEQMARYHPKEPHWFLPFIGVDPIQQGKGCGGALMQHALVPCDRDRTLAYLESSNPKNIPI